MNSTSIVLNQIQELYLIAISYFPFQYYLSLLNNSAMDQEWNLHWIRDGDLRNELLYGNDSKVEAA